MEDENIIDPVEPVAAPTEESTDETTGAEPAEVDELAEEPAEPAAKKENRVQARIDEITREKHEARKEAEYWKKVASGEIQAPKQEPQYVAPVLPNYPAEPALDQFEDYDQYNRALVRWEAGRMLAERDYQADQRKAQEAKQAVYKTHQDRVQAAKSKYADFDEVIALAPEIRFNDLTFGAVLESDNSADLQYYFSSKPEEAARINALLPVQQIKEIAKLEDKFSKSAPPVKRVTQAPQPINAIGGSGAGVVDPANMTDEQWLEAERKRLAAKGRRY